MRRWTWIAAVIGSYALMLSFLAVLVLSVTSAFSDGWAIGEAAAARTDSSPRFSPDGSLVAFLRGTQLWVVRLDGSDAQPLTRATRFAWAAHGDALLVTRGGRRVFAVSAAGGPVVAAGRAALPRTGSSDRSRGRVVFVRRHRIWLREADGSVVELT